MNAKPNNTKCKICHAPVVGKWVCESCLAAKTLSASLPIPSSSIAENVTMPHAVKPATPSTSETQSPRSQAPQDAILAALTTLSHVETAPPPKSDGKGRPKHDQHAPRASQTAARTAPQTAVYAPQTTAHAPQVNDQIVKQLSEQNAMMVKIFGEIMELRKTPAQKPEARATEMQEALKRIERLEQALVSEIAAKNVVESRLQDANREIDELAALIKKHVKVVEGISASVDKRIVEINDSIVSKHGTAIKRIDGIDGKLTGLKARVDSAVQSVNNLDSSINSKHNTAIERINTTVSDLDKRIIALEPKADPANKDDAADEVIAPVDDNAADKAVAPVDDDADPAE